MATVEKKKEVPGLLQLVFSWSLSDIMNKDLFRNKVNKISDKFSSADDYLNSFVNPLIEETHSDLHSCVMTVCSSPMCEIYQVKQSKDFQEPRNLEYMVRARSEQVNSKKQPVYEPGSGDIIALTDVIPKCIDDLNRPKRSYTVAYVLGRKNASTNKMTILSSKPISSPRPEEREVGDRLFVVYLTNLTTNLRIWNALHPDKGGYMEIIKSVLHYDSTIKEDCIHCLSSQIENINLSKMVEVPNTFGLDESQNAAVSKCIALAKCGHRNYVKLIWGPPGSGKTKTIASLALNILNMRCRTLICAPTNIAVIGVAKRLMDLRAELKPGSYGLGDIVLFGNPKRMKIDEHEELVDVFLDNRASVLAKCFAWWTATLDKMIYLLDDPNKQYQLYLHSKKKDDTTLLRRIISAIWLNNSDNRDSEDKLCSFEKFFMKRFNEEGKKLNLYINGLCTHMPTWSVSMETQKQLINIEENLRCLEISAKSIIDDTRCLKNALMEGSICARRLQCLNILKFLKETFCIPKCTEHQQIMNFCLENARLVFCTVSSSARLHTEGMKAPLQLAVIDEAAQLKECESCIPLQLSGLRHAILVGDEKQLPAMVASKISERAGFGRSLFERLVTLGCNKHLLNVQYRMHPNISLFPNEEFYKKEITNGHNVLEKSYEKQFLPGKLFGSYSFINVINGKEEFDNSRSRKNVVEVHVVAKIVSKLYEECIESNKKVRVGCISPYKAQVYAIQKFLGNTYSTDANDIFSVTVRSIDDFQGGEEDVIIISTVRSNVNGSIGFLSNRQRTNVALTRARYCLWILGNEGTLMISRRSVWKKLVMDAKTRGCFYNVYEEKSLCLATGNALVELGQLQSLFSTDSVIFKASEWKVCFGAKFLESIARIRNVETCKQVVALLMKLSEGWRQHHKDKTASLMDVGASHPLLEWCDIDEEKLKLVWTIEIFCENSTDTQVIKILDIVPPSEISAYAKVLGTIAHCWSASNLSRCMYKRVEGEFTLPKSWPSESGDTSVFIER